jgi:hypothetical protein
MMPLLLQLRLLLTSTQNQADGSWCGARDWQPQVGVCWRISLKCLSRRLLGLVCVALWYKARV